MGREYPAPTIRGAIHQPWLPLFIPVECGVGAAIAYQSERWTENPHREHVYDANPNSILSDFRVHPLSVAYFNTLAGHATNDGPALTDFGSDTKCGR